MAATSLWVRSFILVTQETGMELQLLAAMGYDAVAVGNHEFDFQPKGFRCNDCGSTRTKSKSS